MNRFKRARLDRGLSQVDAAQGARVGLATIQRIEAGNFGNVAQVRAVAAFYGLDDLLLCELDTEDTIAQDAAAAESP